jgi:integrase
MPRVDKVQLREMSVQRAKPKPEAYNVWDAGQNHLCLRVRPTGHKSWACVYSRGGRSRWLTLGDADIIPLADARVMAAEAMLAVAKGKDPAAERAAQRSRGTFQELAARYFELYASKRNKSWRQPEALIRSHALPRLGKLSAASITRSDVQTMMSRMASPSVATQTLAAVSAVFTWAIREQLLTANPCKLIDRHQTKDRERVLAESELPIFWRAFGELPAPQGAALKAILLTGQRPGEIRHMRREHLKDGWWSMPGEEVPEIGWKGTKNGAAHRVWIPAPVRELIAGDAKTGFVFADSRGRPLCPFDAVMRTICAKLNVESTVTPHDLRRTFLTKVTGMKFGRDAMDRIANHKDDDVTDTYDRHGYADEDRHIMETVAAKIMATVEEREDTGGKVLPFRA